MVSIAFIVIGLVGVALGWFFFQGIPYASGLATGVGIMSLLLGFFWPRKPKI